MARQMITLIDARTQSVCDRLQQDIGAVIVQTVVNQLEVIDIDDQQRHNMVGNLCLKNGILQMLFEKLPIG